MAESVNACVFPGSTSCSAGASGLGWVTSTLGIAALSVAAVSLASAVARERTPWNTRAASTKRPRITLYFAMVLLPSSPRTASVQQAEDRRDEHKCGGGGTREAADDGSSQRRVLLSALAQSKGRGDH